MKILSAVRHPTKINLDRFLSNVGPHYLYANLLTHLSCNPDVGSVITAQFPIRASAYMSTSGGIKIGRKMFDDMEILLDGQDPTKKIIGSPAARERDFHFVRHPSDA